MMLADAEGVDAHCIGEHPFVDDVADHLRVRQGLAVGTDGDVAESVQSDSKSLCHACRTDRQCVEWMSSRHQIADPRPAVD